MSAKNKPAFSIGSVAISNPLVLAPVVGGTCSSFRVLARRFGCGLVFTEPIGAEALLAGDTRARAALRFREEERPVVVRLVGRNGGAVAGAGRLLDNPQPDIVHVALVCPGQRRAERPSPGELVRGCERLAKAVEAARRASAVSVMASVTTSRAAATDVVHCCRILERSGASALIVQARRADETAGWPIIRAAKQAVGVPVVADGEVRGPDECLAVLSDTGCDGVMIGAAALSRPWVFAQCLAAVEGRKTFSPPSQEERLAMAAELAQAVPREFPGMEGLVRAKRHLCWFSRGLPSATYLRRRLHLARSVPELLEAWQGYGRGHSWKGDE